MKAFWKDLLDWMVFPSSYWLYLDACHQERMQRRNCTKNNRKMKNFLLDLLDWIATPSTFWLYVEACDQERIQRQKGTED